jgi:hypothetical protein
MYILAPNQTVEKFPYSIGDLRKDNPQTSFPKNPSVELLASYNVFPVVSVGAQYDPLTQVAEPNGCTYNADLNRWETAWTVQDKTATEIDAARSTLWEQVKAERKRRTEGGVLVSGHWLQTDPDSRIQFLRLDQKAAAALAAGGQPTDMLTVVGQDIYWKTYDNGLVPMTIALAQGIAAAIEVLDALAFARGEQLRAQIEASTAPESIDITSGWPPIYEA